ncbi:S41 family peptidase [Flavobacterium panacagri]|uniref:S41 family peptidase n=1 Tax=Flavobacterium panacagri TaxID=3034146 RepID=UPI0025A5E2A7|nr:S41 family peptidase [Flavobacterium panacagri]
MKKIYFLLIVMLLFSLSFYSQNSKKLSRPEQDFETFWTTFKNNYAFFDLKKVDWEESYKKYRPQVTKETTEKELLKILEEMVSPLQDGHITILKGEEVIYKYKKQSPFLEEFKGIQKQLWETSLNTLEKDGFSKMEGSGPLFNNVYLYNSCKSKDLGFIRISRCFGTLESLFDDKKEKQDINLMLTLFDSILKSFADTKGIIIDLRANGGGHAGELLAKRFVSEKRLTHYKSIKEKGDYNNFSVQKPIYIEPNNEVQYLKPIVILTNDKTASSAEDFTISLYQQANVTTIGTNTSGMMSDMFDGKLSKNILFTLSNQRYYSTDKKLLEDVGVPVKIEMKNSKQDIENKVDPLIQKAIEVLN